MSISSPRRPLFIAAQKDGDPPMRACDIPITAYGKSTKAVFRPGAPARNTRNKARAKDELLGRQGHSARNILPPGQKRFRRKPNFAGAALCAGYLDIRNIVVVGQQIAIPYDNATRFACFDHYRLAQVNIQLTGARATDAIAANNASIATNALNTPNTTWHHVADYSALTGFCSMQLVLTAIHGALNHRGGVWQWEQANVGNYGP